MRADDAHGWSDHGSGERRDGDGEEGRYSNTEETATYLDSSKPTYIGGMLEMLDARLFRYWDDLGEAVKTGRPQNETKHGRKPIFEELYSELPRLEQFLGGFGAVDAAVVILVEGFEEVVQSHCSFAQGPHLEVEEESDPGAEGIVGHL